MFAAALLTALFAAATPARAPAAASQSISATPRPAPAPTGERRWDYVVIPIAFYAPETSMAFGAGGFVFEDTPGAGGARRRDDSLALVAIGTVRQQFVVGLEGVAYRAADRLRLGAKLAASRFPTRYWGLGNATGDEYESFTPSRVAATASLGLRLVEELYLGVSAGAAVFRVSGYAPDGRAADYFTRHRPRGGVVAVGPFLYRDTRDDAVGPRSGSFTSVTALFAPAALGGSHAHHKLELDQRTYLPTPLAGVLALQLYGELAGGDVPLGEMPALGGSARLRGFYEGRYRDRVYLMTQAEWRVPLVWRLALAPFAAAGDVFPTLDALTAEHLKLAGGLGVRFRLKKTRPLHLRLDLAGSAEGRSVYLHIGEAF